MRKITKVNDVLDDLRAKLYTNVPHELIENLEKLSKLCQMIENIAPSHDWNGVKFNGYRSILKICHLFMDTIKQTLSKPYYQRKSLIHVTNLLIYITNQAINYHEDSKKPKDPEELVTKVFNDLRASRNEVEDDLKYYWGYHPLFWMTPDSRWVPLAFSTIFTMIHKLPRSLLACISSPEFGNIMTVSTLSATVFFPINLANYVNNIATRFFSRLRFKFSGVHYDELHLPRQNDWIIDDNGNRITASSADASHRLINSRESVLCHLMKDKGRPVSGDVVIYAQGGGFIIDARPVHEEYLRDWVKQLNGAVILNVIYSRFVRYPVALQEILDVYLWLINSKDAQRILGFKPRRMILCGDSAGSYLLFSLALVLRDIQIISPTAVPIYPVALVGFNPILSVATSNIFSSFLLSYLDVFLGPSLLLHCFSLYGSGVVHDSDCYDLDNNNANNSLWFTGQDPYSETSFWRNFYNTWFKEGTSWFDCDQELFLNRVRKLTTRILMPYISPLVSYDLNLITDLKLYLISSELDPLLDNSIEIAESWKGKISFDVVEDMAHGFTASYAFSNSAARATNFCLKKLQEALSSS